MGQDWLKPPASNGFRPPPLLPPQRAAKSPPASPAAPPAPPAKRGVDALSDDILVAVLAHLDALDLARIARGTPAAPRPARPGHLSWKPHLCRP